MDLGAGDDRGFCNALANAKRATCARIDRLILANYLLPFVGKTYPEKTQVLRDIGISIPPVIHELIIDPRNEAEHGYKLVNSSGANRAVGVAELFIQATSEEAERVPIVALNWNVNYSFYCGKTGEKIEFHGFATQPMLFIDVSKYPRR
ncbi:MAG: hypothetical protein HY652_10025 [Acidobacteria bacterium]|nr:hypothetical protein [Acidobacteriota bacterium]